MEKAWEFAAVSDEGFSVVEIVGIKFDRIFLTEVGERDGYAIQYVEVNGSLENARMLEVFKDHQSGKCTFKTWGNGIPNAAIEQIIAHAVQEFSGTK